MHVDQVTADIPRPWMNTMGGLPCPSLTTCNRVTRAPLGDSGFGGEILELVEACFQHFDGDDRPGAAGGAQ